MRGGFQTIVEFKENAVQTDLGSIRVSSRRPFSQISRAGNLPTNGGSVLVFCRKIPEKEDSKAMLEWRGCFLFWNGVMQESR